MTDCLHPRQECSPAIPPGQRATYRSLGEPPRVYNNVYTSYFLTLWIKAITVPTRDFWRKELSFKTWKVLSEMNCRVWNTLLKERWSGAEGSLHWQKLVEYFSSYIWLVKMSPQSVVPGWQQLQPWQEGKKVCRSLEEGCAGQVRLRVWATQTSSMGTWDTIHSRHIGN